MTRLFIRLLPLQRGRGGKQGLMPLSGLYLIDRATESPGREIQGAVRSCEE